MENTKPKKHREDTEDEEEIQAKKPKIAVKPKNQFLVYDVLRIIFKYLNGMDLSNASRVCRCWLQAAQDEKQSRGPVCFMESSNSVNQQIIKNLKIKPALGLFFETTGVRDQHLDCYADALPPNCYTIRLTTYGLIHDSTEIEGDVQNFVCAFLPDIPNVTIKTFAIRKIDYSHVIGPVVMKCSKKFYCDLRQALGEPNVNNGQSKCLLLFSFLYDNGIAVRVSKALKKKYKHQPISVWGGIAKDLLVCNSAHGSFQHYCAEPAHSIGIVLSGALKTWSIVVYHNYKTKSQVEERIKLLRESVQLQKYSIGFMFACCERGSYMFKERNVESSIFKRYFPEVPLAGCFGAGEIGNNSIEGPSGRPWHRVASTVFLILTYG